MKRLILASASPRRRELLANAGFAFEVAPAEVDESYTAGEDPAAFAERLALPALAVQRIPRTLVFWTVWTASAISLVLILAIPSAARMFRVEPPSAAHAFAAVAWGALTVGWRLVRPGMSPGGSRITPGTVRRTPRP